MAVREIVKLDGTKVCQVYQRWYDVLLEVVITGFFYMFLGVFILFSTPVLTIYCMFYPDYPGVDDDYESSKRRDCQDPFSAQETGECKPNPSSDEKSSR